MHMQCHNTRTNDPLSHHYSYTCNKQAIIVIPHFIRLSHVNPSLGCYPQKEWSPFRSLSIPNAFPREMCISQASQCHIIWTYIKPTISIQPLPHMIRALSSWDAWVQKSIQQNYWLQSQSLKSLMNLAFHEHILHFPRHVSIVCQLRAHIWLIEFLIF